MHELLEELKERLRSKTDQRYGFTSENAIGYHQGQIDELLSIIDIVEEKDVDYCTRKKPHDGPCNGFLTAACKGK